MSGPVQENCMTDAPKKGTPSSPPALGSAEQELSPFAPRKLRLSRSERQQTGELFSADPYHSQRSPLWTTSTWHKPMRPWQPR